MKTSTIVKLGILVLIIIILFISISSLVNYANKDMGYRNLFKAKFSERTAFYDKMWKVISQKGQVAVENDSSFRNNINAIMQGRKDADQLMMKWIQESNPNANFDQVSVLYQDLSRTIEAEREGFFDREKSLQDIKMQDDNLITQFPSSVFLSILSRKEIEYKPITSDQTDQVIETGKDNNTKVF